MQSNFAELSGIGFLFYRHQKLKFRHNLYKLREERNIKPSTFGELVSSMLYEKRCGSPSWAQLCASVVLRSMS